MLFHHATLTRNLPSIGRQGLLTSRALGRRKAVWLHTAARKLWAAVHTIRRHGGRVEDVAILEIDVPRRWLRRGPAKGTYYVCRDILPDRIGRCEFFGVFSK